MSEKVHAYLVVLLLRVKMACLVYLMGSGASVHSLNCCPAGSAFQPQSVFLYYLGACAYFRTGLESMAKLKCLNFTGVSVSKLEAVLKG